MHNEKSTLGGYWYSFSIGAILGGSAVFFFGTKQGRKMLKKIADSFEDIEQVAEEYIDNLSKELEEQH